MRDRLLARLQDLKAEYETGQKALADLEDKQANLQATLLRIAGAIQVGVVSRWGRVNALTLKRRNLVPCRLLSRLNMDSWRGNKGLIAG